MMARHPCSIGILHVSGASRGMLPKPGPGAASRRHVFDSLVESIVHGGSKEENAYCPAGVVLRTGCGRHLSGKSRLSWTSAALGNRSVYGTIEPALAPVSLRYLHAKAIVAVATRNEALQGRPTRGRRFEGAVSDRCGRTPLHSSNRPADPIQREPCNSASEFRSHREMARDEQAERD